MIAPAARWWSCAAAGLVGLGTWAQTYKLRAIGAEEGLTNAFAQALAQDASGHLWIGTGEGAGRYDGRRVTFFTTKDSLAEDYVSAIHPAPDGTLWFGHNEGGVTRLDRGAFHPVQLDSLATSTISAIVDDGANGIWAVAQNNGLLHVDATGHGHVSGAQADVLWYTLLRLPTGDLLAGASDGLHLFHPGTDGTAQETAHLGVTTATVRALAAYGDRLYAGTEGEGIIAFRLEDATPQGAVTLGADEGLGGLMVKDLAIGESGQLLVATFGSGAYELGLDGDAIATMLHYHAGNGLGTDNVNVVFVDSENSIWFSRFGTGVARLLDRAIVYYAADEAAAQNVRSIAVDDDEAWFGAHAALLHTATNVMGGIDTLGRASGLPDDDITALLRGPDGHLWVGTSSQGLFRRDDKGRFAPVPSADDLLSRSVNALTAIGGTVWVATANGVYGIDSARTRHFTTENGLLHNKVNHILADRQGRLWMACNNGGVSVYGDNEIRSFTLTQQGNAYHVTGIAQDTAGTMWFSTYGNGVWHTHKDSVRAVTAAQGLRSDYCYGIAADARGQVWVTHRGGVSRIRVGDQQVKVYDKQFGIVPDRGIHTVVADPRGSIWFGSDAGVVRYDLRKDLPALHPPHVVLTGIKVFDRQVPPTGSLELAPDIYRLQFDFLGISLKDPGGLTYQYKLEGHDPDWNTVTSTSALYVRVQDGAYTFRVRACDADGRCSEAPASVHITIRTPVWKRTWFIGLCVAAGLLTIYGIFRIRERNQRRAKELLQRALDERTHELKTKKEEIEQKNADITSSITYAQHIQQAILPAQAALSEILPRSFILHQPRDIVSGDFYWFRRFGRKFILACADCTGHGVPGAFMSMIGSMLLREVSAEQAGAPHLLLQRLDTELRNVLHYHSEETSSKDGMDISLCELDLDTRHLRLSAAMQDVLIMRDGELVRQRGTRHSIGGVLRNGGLQHFDLHEEVLRPGDRIYLFSDGVPDQFGGDSGKKLKVAGLMELVMDVAHLPMDEQGLVLRRRFREWMGDHDQLDDVLLIGVEV